MFMFTVWNEEFDVKRFYPILLIETMIVINNTINFDVKFFD